MTPPEAQTWIIVVEPDHVLDAVAALERLGFDIEQKLDAVDAIIARGSTRQAHEARSITGVVDVSPDAPIDIGPPDAAVS